MKTLESVLKPYGKDKCPKCNRTLDEIDVSWNNASTEAGTGYCVLNVTSECCMEDICSVSSWYPSIDDYEEFLSVLEDELKEASDR